MPQLILFIEGDFPQIIRLVDGQMSIGRDIDNVISVKEPSVSAFHAEINTKPDGSFEIKDLESSNGTTINGIRINSLTLIHEDRVAFGRVAGVFLDWSAETSESVWGGGHTERVVVKSTDHESEGSPLLKRTSELEDKVRKGKRELIDLQTSASNAKKDKEDLERRVADLTERANSAKLESDSKVEVLEQATATIAVAKLIEGTQAKIDTHLESSKTKLDEIKGSISDKTRNLGKLSEQIAIQKQHIESAQAEVAELETKNELLRKEIADSQQTKQSLEQQNVALQKEVDKKSSLLTELETDINSKQQTKQSIQIGIEENEARQQLITEKIISDEKQIQEQEQTLIEKRKVFDDLNQELHNRSVAIEESEVALNSVNNQHQRKVEELAEFANKQKSLQSESALISKTIIARSDALDRLDKQFEARQSGAPACPPLRMIYPSFNSLLHFFYQGAEQPGTKGVVALGRCGLAAASKGSIHREVDTVPDGVEPVFIQLSGDIDYDEQMVDYVADQLPDRAILVCWHDHLPNIVALKKRLIAMLNKVSGVVSINTDTYDKIQQLKCKPPHINLPLPCPLDYPVWDHSIPLSDKKNSLLLSIDGFDSNVAIHRDRIELINALVAKTRKLDVTLYHHTEGFQVEGLDIPSNRVNQVSGRYSYPEYLEMVKQHRFLAGFGKNSAGGDMLGDSLLTGGFLIGADGGRVIEELLYPNTCLGSAEFGTILEQTKKIMADEKLLENTISSSRKLAIPHLSFGAINYELGEFLNQKIGI